MEVQYISLNMTPTGVNPCFHISQYDVGRTLGFIVHSGGATVDLDTYTCTVEATRSDGTAITSAVATTENIGTFEVTPTMSNKADKYRCQLVIVDENSKRIASLPFDMEVTKAAMDENSEAIEEDASLYQQYTKAVQGAIAEANANIQAEENARIAAVGAEATARANADTALQNNINAEATARANADTTLQNNINAEATARADAITAETAARISAVNAEASTRATQDASLQSQINQLVAPSGEAPSAAEVQNARIGADGTTYSTLGDAIRGQVSDIKSIQVRYASSTFNTGTTNVANKRLLLNYEAAIPDGIMLGDLVFMAHNVSISTTIKVDLTNKNSNGSYTVYDSIQTTASFPAVVGNLYKFASIKKETHGKTYVFVTFGSAKQIELASAQGKAFYVSDNALTDTTFTTRSVSDYEICYLIYAGMTSTHVNGLTDSIDALNTVVGDYTYHQFFNAAQSSGFWNSYIYKTVPIGTKVRITLLSNSANLKFNVRAYDAGNNSQLIGVIGDVGGTVKATLTLDAVNIRIQSQISSAISNATFAVVVTTDTQPGLVSDLFDTQLPRVYHIEKDGSGDFTNLAKGIAVATQWFDSIVYVGAGTWDILEELGQDYLDTASTANQGIVLKNRVHVICSSKAYIKCLYDGTNANVIDHISAFNAGPYGFTLENADIEVANVRYCVHDERNAETDHYDNYYINCRMKNTNQAPGSRSQCIGGGLGYDGHIVIDGCTFENPLRDNYGVVSYHNAHGVATDSRSRIEVKGCYFYGTNTFRAGYYGNTTAITQCLVHGNSMGAEPYITQEDPNYPNVNMEIIAWNNEIRTA